MRGEGGFAGGAGEPLGFCEDSLASLRNCSCEESWVLVFVEYLCASWPPPSILQVSQEVAESGSSDLVLVLVRVFFLFPATLLWL